MKKDTAVLLGKSTGSLLLALIFYAVWKLLGFELFVCLALSYFFACLKKLYEKSQ